MNTKLCRYIVLLAVVFLWPSTCLDAADIQDTRISPYMLFTYLKDTDSQKILQVKMTNITQTGETPLPDLTIRFYNNEALLGEAVTDKTGSASHIIDSSVQFYRSEDGSWPFLASFDGDSLVDQTSSELSITDVNIEMTLSEEEGKKTVRLKATMPTRKGPLPVSGEEIGVYVPRMLSMLPVVTGTLEDDGTIMFNFPDDIPGDSLGNLEIIGRFNDHYLFGNVEKREVKHWGVAVVKIPPVYRSLWSTLAPKWMVVTLSIMLMGVWGHYIFVIISLVRIKIAGRKNEEG